MKRPTAIGPALVITQNSCGKDVLKVGQHKRGLWIVTSQSMLHPGKESDKMKSAMRKIAFTLALLLLAACTSPTPSPVSPTPTTVPVDEFAYTEQREQMVLETIIRRGISDENVLEAMRTVPRHHFVTEEQRRHAYGDYPLPIGFGQTISQPYIVALMTELLELRPGDRVLEIGTGSGYQAAILAAIPQVEVYSIEIIPELAQRAQEALQQQGYEVHCRQGDGYYGWEEQAPFDAIIVTAAPDHIPAPLIDQLAEGGRMVIPVGPPGGYQTLWKFVKEPGGEIKAYNMGGVAFVPFTGPGADEHYPDGGYEWPFPR